MHACSDNYYYTADAEFMSAAFLLDVASYYFGLVIRAYRNPEQAFLELPFHELYDGFVPDFRVTKLLRKGLFR